MRNRKGVFDDGSEYVRHVPLCPKCSCELKITYKSKGGAVKTIHQCTHCKYTKREFIDFNADDDMLKKKQEKDKRLLRKYRSEYCLSEEEGNEYILSTDRIKEFVEEVKKDQKQSADPIYQRMKKINKLSVVELEKILRKVVGKNKFKKLVIEKPEINKYVIVPFTIQDGDESRAERDCILLLQKIIKKTLLFWHFLQLYSRIVK